MCVTSVDCCWCSFLVLFILYFCSFNNVACLSNCHEFCRSNVYRRGSLSVIFLYDLFLHFPVVGYRYRQTNWGLLGHVSEAKRERRRAERQWLKCGLEVHKQIFRSACKLVNKIVQQAKLAFFNTKILACISSKQLFSITNTLLGKSKTSSLPQRFCDFFENKISTIRDNLNSQTMPLPPVTHTVFDGSPLTAFHPVSESSVRKVLNKTAIKTCELDPLPSWLLADLINDLLLSFTSVISDSLLTGLAAFLLCSNPPLSGRCWKKSSLDTENFKNYRPVFNCPPFPRSLKRLSSFNYPNILKAIISFTPFSLPIA